MYDFYDFYVRWANYTIGLTFRLPGDALAPVDADDAAGDIQEELDGVCGVTSVELEAPDGVCGGTSVELEAPDGVCGEDELDCTAKSNFNHALLSYDSGDDL